jgi:Type IV secretion-system coupling protein DNA-binding domain
MDGAIARGDRLLALDVKGDVTARFPSEDFCLLSLDDARSRRWLLGLDIVTREDAVEPATEMIRETSDPSLSGGARQVLTAIPVRLQMEAGKRGKVWSWRQLDHILSKPVAELFTFLKESCGGGADRCRARRNASAGDVLLLRAGRQCSANVKGIRGDGVRIRRQGGGGWCVDPALGWRGEAPTSSCASRAGSRNYPRRCAGSC